jgi:hypothetical protein
MQQQLQQPHQAQQHQQLQSQFLQPVQQQQHMYGRQDAPGGAAGAAGVMRGAAGALRGLQQGPLGAKPYCKYFMKRITTNVSHVLFYVVDAQGLGKLAVVVRQNDHHWQVLSMSTCVSSWPRPLP